MTIPFITGFAVGGSLIVAIGAQNAFVLRQGIKREHVFAVALFCALSDAILIALGVAGLGFLIERVPGLINAVTIFGIVFLVAYGLMAAKRALAPSAMQVGQGAPLTLKAALYACAAFTLLNPHVYLDTVVLLGTVAGSFADLPARAAFAAGASAVSILWFAGLGHGARLLAPVFAKPIAWRIVDLSVAAIMGTVAYSLVRAALDA